MGIRWSMVVCAMAMTSPVFAGPKEDALAAYMKFFDQFTAENHDQIVTLFAPDAQFFGTQSTELVTSPRASAGTSSTR